MSEILSFGETMAMSVAEQSGDLAQVGHFHKRIAGADSNVAIGLSRLGFNVAWLSRVGNDSLAALCSTHSSNKAWTARGGRPAAPHRFSAQVLAKKPAMIPRSSTSARARRPVTYPSQPSARHWRRRATCTATGIPPACPRPPASCPAS